MYNYHENVKTDVFLYGQFMGINVENLMYNYHENIENMEKY